MLRLEEVIQFDAKYCQLISLEFKFLHHKNCSRIGEIDEVALSLKPFQPLYYMTLIY